MRGEFLPPSWRRVRGGSPVPYQECSAPGESFKQVEETGSFTFSWMIDIPRDIRAHPGSSARTGCLGREFLGSLTWVPTLHPGDHRPSWSKSIQFMPIIPVWFFFFFFSFLFSFFFFFLAVPRGLWDLSSPQPGLKPRPRKWKHQVLTNGPLGNFLSVILNRAPFSLLRVLVTSQL